MQRGRFVRYWGILLGCMISASSINLFLVPSHLLSGGLAGISIIFYYLAGLPIGMQMLVYNIPILLASFLTLGKSYTLDMLFGTVLFSICVDLMHFLNAYAPVNDTMLAAIYGGVFNGIGYGIIFRMHGSSGGTDIVAAILKKYYSFNLGGMIFAFNCLIMGAAAVLFGVMPAMYTLISMFMSGFVTDKVIAGFNSCKTVIMISDKTKEIAEGIINEIGRGVTFLRGEGAFTHKEKDVIFVVLQLTQISQLKSLVHEIDPNAFLIVLDASEIMGHGFSLPGVQLAELLRERRRHNMLDLETADFNKQGKD